MPRNGNEHPGSISHTLVRPIVAMALVLVISPWIALRLDHSQVQAQAGTQVMYYVDVGVSTEDNSSTLNRVTLSSGRAYIKIELAGNIPIDTTALASNPDGTRLYMVDLDTANFGYYDVTNGEWSGTQGTIRTPAGTALSTAQAAFSPVGELYIVSPGDDRLRVVNLNCPSTDCGKATLVGTIVEKNSGKAVNVEGGDIVFDGSTLYIWANRGNTADAPRGLYKVDPVVAANGNVETTYLGGANTCPRLFSGSTAVQGVTGMTLDSNSDHLVVSCFNNGTPNQAGRMLRISKTDGSEVASFTMRRTNLDSNFDEHGGDMTTAPDADRPAISATNLTLLDGGGAEGISRLYEVALDATSGQARLKILPGGVVPGDSAALAGISSLPGGDRLYYVSDGLRYYNFSTESVVTIGPILSGTTGVANIAQAAFSPTDQLYIGGDAGTIKNALFRVEYLCNGMTDCANAVYVGTVKRGNATVDVSGADFVFANATTLYLWANNDATGAPRGLYRLTLPAQEGTVVHAEYLSTSTTKAVCSSDAYISGLALDPDGNVLASCVTNSTTTADQIFTISTTNGAVVEGSRFRMHLSGFPGRIYVHAGGDLTGAPGASPIPPAAQSQSVSTAQDTAKQITLRATDVDSSNLTFSTANGPSRGTLSAIDPPICTTSSGTTTCTASVMYSPNPGFTGNDSFSFTATDSPTNLSSAATVSISVTQDANVPPVATDQTVATDEDIPVTITLSGSDTNSTSLTFAIVSGPANGALDAIDDADCATDSGTTTCTATVVYSPGPNFNGSDSFTYVASDGLDNSNVATVSITVNPVNDPPTANDDMAETDENLPVVIDVLANDEDVDGDMFIISAATFATNGDILIDPSLQFVTYTPSAGFTGTDSFTYSIDDGEYADTATVTITVNEVNDPPTAVDDGYLTAEDTELVVGPSGVLGNDTDDGGTLLAEVVDEPANGSLSLNADGSFSYSPNPHFNGTDSFTYQASDGTASSGLATVTITVTPVNDVPLAEDAAISTDEDVPVEINLTGSDVETSTGDLTFTIVDEPVNGTLSGSAPDLTYTPDPEYSGPDSFTFTVTDTGDGSSPPLSSAPGTVTITVNPVNDPPVAADDDFATDEDTELVVNLGGLLDDDVDIEGDELTAELVSGPLHGSLNLNADGTFSYMPDANYHGSDSFTYRASDGQSPSNEATVTITISPVNDAPSAEDDVYTTDEDTPLTMPVLSNDADVDGESLSITAFTQPANGSVSLNPDGTLGYTPDPNYSGPDSFSYTVVDGSGATNDATVTITVDPVNDLPLVDADPGTTVNEGDTFAGGGTFSDIDSPSLSGEVDYGDGSGPQALSLGDGTFSLSYSYQDNGTYTVTVTITDGDGGSASDTLVVTANNVAPIVDAISASLNPQPVNTSITASATFTDPGTLDTHTAIWDWGDGSVSSGTVTESSGSGSVSDSHSYSAPGVYRVKLTVTDDDGDSGESVFEYVVVYDPNGGFVTGGGWIDSPAGAYVADPALEGRANFGFVAKYKKGATVPEGKTEFQFKAGDLNFHSTTYQWLVVAGARAQFKGAGTINGEGTYGFMLTAIDGQVKGGGGSDKFRIKIWQINPDGSEGPVVYDNQLGATDDANPTTVVGSGSIVIHNK